MDKPLPPHRSRPTLGTVLVGLSLIAAAIAAGAAEPAANPARNSTMLQGEAGYAFTAVQLKDLVGPRIGTWQQTGLDVPLESRAAPQNVKLVYAFRSGKQKATLTIVDGGVVSSAPGPAHWGGPPNRRETPAGKEFVYAESGRTVREIERSLPPAREVVLLLVNGIVVTAAGDADMAALKALATGLPLDAAEALKRQPR